MKKPIHSLFALLALLPVALFANPGTDDKPAAKHCGCACCQGKETCCCNKGKSIDAAKPGPAKRYPLKGVIVDRLADQSAFLVKHEEIPGFMPAMTMLFKVDAATFKAAGKGQTITAVLVQKDDGFWLKDVKPAK